MIRLFKRKNEIDFTQGAMTRKIFSYALPIVFSGLFQACFSIADMAVVGKFIGKNAFAAIGSTSSLINLVIQLFLGLSAGVTVVISQYFGAKDNDGMAKASHTAVSVSIIGGIILAVVGVLLTEPLLVLMKSPEETFAMSATYIKIYFSAMPFITVYNFSSGIMRAYGDTERPMEYLVAAGILNVALNLLFVIVFRLGVAGVAFSTFIAQILSSFLALRRITKAQNACRVNLGKLYIDKNSLSRIIKYGIPSGIQSTGYQISGVIIQTAINSFGPDVMAAKGAIVYIENVVSSLSNGFAATATVICAQNYGAKNKKRIIRGLSESLVCNVVLLALFGALFTAASPLLVKLLTNDSAVAKIGLRIAMSYVLFYFIGGVNAVFASAQRGIGHSFEPMITNLISISGLKVLWIYTVFAKYPTVETLYTSYPVTWVVSTIIQVSLFAYFYRRLSFANSGFKS